MKVRKGRRPWPIAVYAIATLASGTFDYVRTLTDRGLLRLGLERALPMVAWNDDLLIVAASAIFSIVLIPLVAIWFFASRIARVIVTVMAVLFVSTLLHSAVSTGFETRTSIVSFVLALFAYSSVALLWVPQAKTWFRRGARVEPAVFE